MTNEEKAVEIAHANKRCYTEEELGCGFPIEYSDDECYDSAMEMAQWKDKQIDTIMLTTEACLKSYFLSQGNSEEAINGFINAIKSQIDKNLEEL